MTRVAASRAGAAVREPVKIPRVKPFGRCRRCPPKAAAKAPRRETIAAEAKSDVCLRRS